MDTNRFHNPKYKKQINAVRGYRRQPRRVPETKFLKFLETIQLGTLARQIAVVLLIGVFVYLIYFAPFLSALEVRVTGANESVANHIQVQYQEYLHGKRWNLFPNKNIIFFSPREFSEHIVKTNFEVARVNSIQKHVDRTVSVEVLQRVPAYIWETRGKAYILNTDGNIGSEAASEDLVKYVRIIDTTNIEIQAGQRVYELNRIQFLDYLKDNMGTKFAAPLERFEVHYDNSSRLTAFTKNGVKIYFDLNTNPEEYLEKLFTLWTNLTPDQQKRLYYIDMRFASNVYVCLQNDPCTQEGEVQVENQSNLDENQ